MRSEVTATYTHTSSGMTHTGYFVNHPDYPLKWTLKGCWDEIISSPRFQLEESKIVAGLQLAQTTM